MIWDIVTHAFTLSVGAVIGHALARQPPLRQRKKRKPEPYQIVPADVLVIFENPLLQKETHAVYPSDVERWIGFVTTYRRMCGEGTVPWLTAYRSVSGDRLPSCKDCLAKMKEKGLLK